MNWTSSLDESAKPTIPVIVGPTGVGKTSVALELVDSYPFEIVSCDSRQIYKYMDIGTAKPSETELAGRPYHLIDYVEPTETYSSARYRDDAMAAIQKILASGKLPLIVGGTGLYLKALITGFFITPGPDYDYRFQLQTLTNAELYNKLRELDINAAEATPVNNRVRIIRALEIFHLTGRTKTELARLGEYPEQQHKFCILELSRSREKLYQFINLRVDKMIGDGLIDEVLNLKQHGLAQSSVLRHTVGYKEVLEYLDGQYQLDRCIELIKQKTRNYAKRQLTWFRSNKDIIQIDLEHASWRKELTRKLDKFKLDT